MAHVMIVEDDPIILDNLRMLLELSGLDVSTASDGEVACDRLHEICRSNTGCPDLIISDLMMPKVDGFELLERVRNSEVFAEIPFVILSAKSEREDLRRANELGASGYLIKPFEVDELLVVIKNMLQGKLFDPSKPQSATTQESLF